MANHQEAAIYLLEPFRTAWATKDPFVEIQNISSAADKKNIFREKEGRRTVRFSFQDQTFFLKHHKGVGWGEIVKNLFQFRLPVLGATNEFDAAVQLDKLGVDTLTPVAYGKRGYNPASQESFLITKDLCNTISLEDYCRSWKALPPRFFIKAALIKKLAASARIMHGNGINHRDFYLCHFLLEENTESKMAHKEDFHCYLIDLHRCQIRNTVPYRWLVKDLGGLLYSALDTGLSIRDYFRFIKMYSGKPLRSALSDPIWADVYENAQKLYVKDFGKMPPAIYKARQ